MDAEITIWGKLHGPFCAYNSAALGSNSELNNYTFSIIHGFNWYSIWYLIMNRTQMNKRGTGWQILFLNVGLKQQQALLIKNSYTIPAKLLT